MDLSVLDFAVYDGWVMETLCAATRILGGLLIS